MNRLIKLLFAPLVILSLASCVARQLAPAKLIYDSIIGPIPSYQSVELQEGFEYLEFQSPEGSGLLFKSYEDYPPQEQAQNAIKVFTVSLGAVIRIQNGLVTHYDTTINKQWINVRTTNLATDEFGNETFDITYDLPKQGLFNLQRKVSVSPQKNQDTVQRLSNHLAKRLVAGNLEYEVKIFNFSPPQHAKPGILNYWFGKEHLQPVHAIVAFHKGEAVYGHQCFTPDYCFDYLIRSTNQPL